MSSDDDRKGRAGAVRQKALRREKLQGAEDHGKRLDDTSAMRRVREIAPLVYGSLDVVEAQQQHMEGVRTSKGAKTVAIHALVQFPTKLLDATDEKHQQLMLQHAVRFMNEFHGGDAVFAARLDRDEKGGHNVDVFLMPRYQKSYKDGRQEAWASVSKFSKQQAKARFFKTDADGKPILDKSGQRISRDDSRAQGSALQDAWFEYMRDEMGLDVLSPQRKKLRIKDRLEPEEYGLRQDQDRLERDRGRLARAKQLHKATVENFDKVFAKAKAIIFGERKKNQEEAGRLAAERAALEAEKKQVGVALAAAQQIAAGKGDVAKVAELQGHRKALRRRPDVQR